MKWCLENMKNKVVLSYSKSFDKGELMLKSLAVTS